MSVTGMACDDDYFALDAATARSIDASLEFTHADGDLDLRLYGPTGTLLAKSEGETDGERIVYGPVAAATYYLGSIPTSRPPIRTPTASPSSWPT